MGRKAGRLINDRAGHARFDLVGGFRIQAVQEGATTHSGESPEALADLRRLPELTIHPVTGEIAERAGGFGDAFPGDPADRIIAATALVLDAALITPDAKLLSVPSLKTVW